MSTNSGDLLPVDRRCSLRRTAGIGDRKLALRLMETQELRPSFRACPLLEIVRIGLDSPAARMPMCLEM